MENPIFTLFTPTFNRAHTIARVYDSLRMQTCKDFEWVVIDDGSTDNTADLIQQWKKEATFPIVYQYQANSGKHVAINRAVQIARGEFFLIADSDDGFLPESLESMLKSWEEIPKEKREEFVGVVSLCQYENGQICSELFPQDPLDTTTLDLRFKYKIRGECSGFNRTSILRMYPFPEDKNLRFIPENIVWDDMARKYKVRCINQPLRVFYQDSGNQVTKADPRIKALPKNYFLKLLCRDFDYFSHDPLTFIKWAILYVRYSLHLSDWGFMNPRRFNRLAAYWLCLLMVPAGVSFFFLDIARR